MACGADKIIDVGCDHGYLSCYMVTEGGASFAYACDVNEGPLAKAKETVYQFDVQDRVTTILSDGLKELDEDAADTIFICGMGGELIADIIERAPHLFDGDVRLILQPMSRQEHLRRALYRLGFHIIDEIYSLSDGKRYLCICAEFLGEPCEISDKLAYLGPDLPHNGDREAYLAYLHAKREGFERIATAKSVAGIDDGTAQIVALFDGRIKEYTV